jgi:N-acetylneuraminic acid mutarotase
MTLLQRYRKNFAVAAILITILSCDDSSGDETITGNWVKVSPFKGRPRSGAVTFTVDNVAFVGLGYDGDAYLGDFYSYNAGEGYWESRTSFPGTFRERAVAFSIGTKGYVGLGYNRKVDNEELGDWWEYDTEHDTWTQLSDFAGTARYNAVAFAIGSKGYVGTGYDGNNYNNDFWEYNPVTDGWTEIKSYPGEKIEEGLAFVLFEKGYVCAGRNNGLYNNDFWEYDPSTTTWTKRSPSSSDSDYSYFTSAVRRHDAAVITTEGKAFIVGGIASTGVVDASVYEFNVATYGWSRKTSFEGSPRSVAVAFTLDDQLFYGTGVNGSRRYDDIWKFNPTESYNSDD